MDLAHRANGPALNELHHAAIVAQGVNLRPHLRDELMPGSSFRNQTRLGYRVR